MGVAKPLLSHTAATPVADRSLESHDRQALSESDHRRHDARTIKAQRPAQQTIRHIGSVWGGRMPGGLTAWMLRSRMRGWPPAETTTPAITRAYLSCYAVVVALALA